MATERKNESLGPIHRRVLKVLATAAHGRDVNALLARGFKFETMADLVRGRLATVRVETVAADRMVIEVARLRITDAGRRALGDDTSQDSKKPRLKRRTTMR